MVYKRPSESENHLTDLCDDTLWGGTVLSLYTSQGYCSLTRPDSFRCSSRVPQAFSRFRGVQLSVSLETSTSAAHATQVTHTTVGVYPGSAGNEIRAEDRKMTPAEF